MILFICTFKNHYENQLSFNHYELASIYKLYGKAIKIMAFDSTMAYSQVPNRRVLA